MTPEISPWKEALISLDKTPQRINLAMPASMLDQVTELSDHLYEPSEGMIRGFTSLMLPIDCVRLHQHARGEDSLVRIGTVSIDIDMLMVRYAEDGNLRRKNMDFETGRITIIRDVIAPRLGISSMTHYIQRAIAFGVEAKNQEMKLSQTRHKPVPISVGPLDFLFIA